MFQRTKTLFSTVLGRSSKEESADGSKPSSVHTPDHDTSPNPQSCSSPSTDLELLQNAVVGGLSRCAFSDTLHPPFPMQLNLAAAHQQSFGRRVQILKNPDFSRSDDILQMVDALASVCVYEAKGQSVATSLAISDERVVMCLACRNGDPEKIKGFLELLWKALGVYVEAAREEEDGTTVDGGGEGETTSISSQVESRKFAVFRHVYGFGALRLRKRIDKHADRLWHLAMVRHEFDLSCIAKDIYDVHEMFRKGVKMDDDWYEMAIKLSAVSKTFERLMKDSDKTLDEWQSWLLPGRSGLPLYRYLNKCVSLHIYVMALLGYAHQNRSTAIFTKKLEIQVIEPMTRPITLRLDERYWRDYLRELVNEAGLTSVSGSTEQVVGVEAERLYGKVKNIAHWKGTVASSVTRAPRSESLTISAQVHPECLLLAYHHAQVRAHASPNPVTPLADYVPPFDYFGSSRPPCYACSKYFQAYHQCAEGTTHYGIRDGRSKVLVPWAAPNLEDADLESAVYKTIRDQILMDLGQYMFFVRGSMQRPGQRSNTAK